MKSLFFLQLFIAWSDDVSAPFVYIPSNFASKTVVTKYAYRISGTEKGVFCSKVTACIFFSDNSWISTEAGNASKSEYNFEKLNTKGIYTGDPSTNGDVVITNEWGREETITIANGKFGIKDVKKFGLL